MKGSVSWLRVFRHPLMVWQTEKALATRPVSEYKLVRVFALLQGQVWVFV